MDGETTREGEGENEIRNYVGLRGESYVGPEISEMK